MPNESKSSVKVHHTLLESMETSMLGASPKKDEEPKNTVRASIPRATYRFQLHREFKIADAKNLLPYLKALGISHVYFSPIMKARPGSMHGYDLIDHSQVNPELGSFEELEEFARELHELGMGLILDLVPNHMGVGKFNSWWMDVLENGPASQFADYFDIDWAPVKAELRGKVAIPILGDSYGNILQSGALKLGFDKERGAISFFYYEHELPLNPLSYPQVLGQGLENLAFLLSEEKLDLIEYQSILTALSHLPGHMETSGFNERISEKSLQMRRLSELCKRNPKLIDFIEGNLRSFDVVDGDIQAIERLHSLLEAQAYRLVFWRVANDEINYRRFFDVNDLAALRTEDARVFADTHQLIFKLIESKLIDGLRIDHPDGLFEPARYFQDLQKTAAEKLGGEFIPGGPLPFYIAVEKILAPFEHIEEDWTVHGSTGYDYLNEVLSVLISNENDEYLSKIYTDFTGQKQSYEEMRYECKETILQKVLASELNVLAHRLSQIAESSWYFRDITLNSLRYALEKIMIHFPVYRTYITPQKIDKKAIRYIDWAISKARKESALTSSIVYDFIRSVLTLELTKNDRIGNNENFNRSVEAFAMKFQQFTGPVMAKSIEDTLFYRYSRFIALNEVGGEPDKCSSSISAFHQKNQQRIQYNRHSMLATSTHDTKRAEDLRARLAVISEMPQEWERRVTLWARMNRSKKANLEDNPTPYANVEYFIYQTLLGSFPLELMGEFFSTETLSKTEDKQEALIQQDEIAEHLDIYRTRMSEYVLKAIKESKQFSSWINQNTEYEDAVTGFVLRILAPGSTNPFLPDLEKFAASIYQYGLLNSLTQTILKLTSPGVPDLYQGTELWDFSLVDPDNRRPVDFAKRQKHLGQINGNMLPQMLDNLKDGRIKLYVISKLLSLKTECEELFNCGNYLPLVVHGSKANNLISFARTTADGRCIIVTVARNVSCLISQADKENERGVPQFDYHALANKNCWLDTSISLSADLQNREYKELFSNKTIDAAECLSPSQLFADAPFSVLIGE